MHFSTLDEFGGVENQNALGIFCFFFTHSHFLITKLNNLVLANKNLVSSFAYETAD